MRPNCERILSVSEDADRGLEKRELRAADELLAIHEQGVVLHELRIGPVLDVDRRDRPALRIRRVEIVVDDARLGRRRAIAVLDGDVGRVCAEIEHEILRELRILSIYLQRAALLRRRDDLLDIEERVGVAALLGDRLAPVDWGPLPP